MVALRHFGVSLPERYDRPRIDVDRRVLECGDLDAHKVLSAQRVRAGEDLDSDHVPSNAALRKRTQYLVFGAPLTAAQEKKMRKAAAYRRVEQAVKDSGLAIAVPSSAHRSLSRTYGGRNSVSRQLADARDLHAAAQRDLDAVRAGIGRYDAGCVARYAAAANRIALLNNDEYDRALLRVVSELSVAEREQIRSVYESL
jgi:hypothetical protein